MKFWNKIAYVAALALVLVTSCKKEEEKANEYLSGKLKISMPAFMFPGDSKSFLVDTLATLSRSDGGTVGYFYTNAGSAKRDTLWTLDGKKLRSTFTITAPDTLATLSFSFGGFGDSDKYYSTSGSAYFTIVKEGVNGEASLTNYKLPEKPETLVDSRDGRSYLVTDVNGTKWMRQNLAWEGAGRPYQDANAISSIFGRYYTWEEAQNACPDGWRLPCDADFVALAKSCGITAAALSGISGIAGDLMEDVYFNGSKMWEYWGNVRITNKCGLSIMPTGYARIEDGAYAFDGYEKYGALWTADGSEDLANFRYVYVDKTDMFLSQASKTDFAVPVRCVK